MFIPFFLKILLYLHTYPTLCFHSLSFSLLPPPLPLNMESDLCLLTTHGACPGSWSIYTKLFHRRSNQMPISPWMRVEVGLHTSFSSSMLRYCLIWTCADLPCAVTDPARSYCPVVSGNHCLLEVIYHLWLWKSFCPLLDINFWALRRGVWYRRLGLSIPKSLILCTLASCGLWVVVIYYTKPLWWRLNNTLLYGHSNMSLAVILLLYQFSRI